MKRQTVLILFGGVSNEYEVSLRSAASVIENLDRECFDPLLLGVTRDGRWLLCRGKDPAPVAADRWQEDAVPAILSPDRSAGGVLVPGEGRIIPVDVVFPVMHGQNCEDGAVQGLLELSNLPYVGCRVTSSALAFDKVYTHIVAERIGVPMARWELVCAEEDRQAACARVAASLGFPCFVKPANSGSSVGCSRADDAHALGEALAARLSGGPAGAIEELVTAQEVECAVCGNLDPAAPTTGEIVTADGFYDYDTKYKTDTARLYIPAQIPQESAARVRELAVRVFRVLDCRGLSRVDFFVKQDGSVLFNEINTLPGFTSISMYPKMMIASGMTYSGLITRLIGLALEEHEAKKERNR